MSRTPSPNGANNGVSSSTIDASHLVNKTSNYSWFFSNDTNSLLSCMLKKYLRPLGWSKKRGRHLKRPSLPNENDLFKLLVHFNDNFSLKSNNLAESKNECKSFIY